VTLLVAAAACGTANRYSGMDAEALFLMATEEFSEDKYADAAGSLDRILLLYTDWERLPEARMLLADAHYNAGDYLTARAEYERFLDRYSGHDDAVSASFGVCRSLAALSPDMPRDQVFTRDAITVCRNV